MPLIVHTTALIGIGFTGIGLASDWALVGALVVAWRLHFYVSPMFLQCFSNVCSPWFVVGWSMIGHGWLVVLSSIGHRLDHGFVVGWAMINRWFVIGWVIVLSWRARQEDIG